MRILAISGSLRVSSSNTALLRAAALLAPKGMEITLYEGLGNLPHFNPDLEEDPPPAVGDLRTRVRDADALLISSPEYAHGVPGVLKNALDWLVGGSEFIGKPVALLNASPRSTIAQASLRDTITVMSGRMIDAACAALPLLGRNLDESGIVADRALSSVLRDALTALATGIAR
jgi:chromate reductase, NAD(P)H dehydrogenase (quinone)